MFAAVPSRCTDIEHIEECSDLHLFGVIARLRFREVENKIGATFGEPDQ